jgi:hypothetical protein
LEGELNPRQYFVDILIKSLPGKTDVLPHCDQYFSLLSNLVMHAEAESLQEYTLEFIREREILETRESEL